MNNPHIFGADLMMRMVRQGDFTSFTYKKKANRNNSVALAPVGIPLAAAE
jgi:hypothetical protein